MDPRRDAIAGALARLAPTIPPRDAASVADQALHSTGLCKASAEAAAWLSMVAYARHNFTDYDDLLAEGYDVDSARFFSLEALNEVLASWGVRRQVGSEDG